MSNNKRPLIDLSSGTYDALEQRASQYLGIKTLLVRDWDMPDICSYSCEGGKETFSNNDPVIQKLTRAYTEWYPQSLSFKMGHTDKDPGPDPVKTAQAESLRTYLQKRDLLVSLELFNEELESILRCGHVTLRDSNVRPAKALILMDPLQRIKNNDQLIEHLCGTFTNAWASLNDPQSWIPAANFLENFDIALEDYRVDKVLRDARYALSHQFEYESQDKNWSFHPHYYRLANLIAPADETIEQISRDMTFHEIVKRIVSPDIFQQSSAIVTDNKLPEKLARMQTVTSLFNSAATSKKIFAGLYALHVSNHINENPFQALTDRQISGYADTLLTRIGSEIKTRMLPGADIMFSMNLARDLRVTAPIFREIKDTLNFDGPGKIYLDTIWKGLQTYFPTLAEAPVPVLGQDQINEPPRTLRGYKWKQAFSRQQKPQP